MNDASNNDWWWCYDGFIHKLLVHFISRWILTVLERSEHLFAMFDDRASGDLSDSVFHIARIFGYWPSTGRISEISKYVPIRVCDKIRMTFLCVIYLFCGSFGLFSDHLTTIYNSSIEAMINCYTVMIMASVSIYSMLMNIRNRNILLRIILINRHFDRKVSRADAWGR